MTTLDQQQQDIIATLRASHAELAEALPTLPLAFVVTVGGLSLKFGDDDSPKTFPYGAPNVCRALDAQRFTSRREAERLARLVRNGKGEQGKVETLRECVARSIEQSAELIASLAK